MVEAAPQVTYGNGHSGTGWYMHDTEYPEDGAVFLGVAAPLARQEPKPDSVYPVQPSSEAATARDAWYGGSSMDASMLRNLLAVIHGDGGHYVAQHGIEKAAEDAEKLVAERFAASLSSTPAPTVLHGFEAVQMEGGGSVLKPVTLELPARGAQRTPEASCWLVEKRRDGRTVAYLGHRCGSHEWVPNPGMATRFVRREDANGVAECIETDDVIVAEHIWG
jgi:hypothetical protein